VKLLSNRYAFWRCTRLGKNEIFFKLSADILLMRLAYLLGSKSKKDVEWTVIVQNAPRTGRHDHETAKYVCLHKFNRNHD
jgi:hypothetical protein